MNKKKLPFLAKKQGAGFDEDDIYGYEPSEAAKEEQEDNQQVRLGNMTGASASARRGVRDNFLKNPRKYRPSLAK